MYRVGQTVTLILVDPGSRAYSGFCRLESKNAEGLVFKTELDVRVSIVGLTSEALEICYDGVPCDVTVIQEGKNPNGQP